MPQLPWLAKESDKLKADGLWRARRRVDSLVGGWCEIDGRRLRNFASNDYLDLAHDPRLKQAAEDAMRELGVGATASALVAGRSAYHVALEEKLAAFEGQESAVLFPSGFAANVGTIDALVDDEDIVFCDRLNHASLYDGCWLSEAKLRVYRHQELGKLESALNRAGDFRRRWIVTDSIFSMDGDAAPLPELCDLAEQFDAQLIVDEAHATGLFGKNGRGAAEWQGVDERIAVRVGTLSKAVGTLGGFVAGSTELTDWLWNRARSQVFSTALPPAICAAAAKAMEIIESEPWRRKKLLELSHALRNRLSELGFKIPAGGVGPIVPVIFGNVEATMRAAEELKAAGFLVGAIRPPTVPKGQSRIRLSLTSAVSNEDIDALVSCFEELKARWPHD